MSLFGSTQQTHSALLQTLVPRMVGTRLIKFYSATLKFTYASKQCIYHAVDLHWFSSGKAILFLQ